MGTLELHLDAISAKDQKHLALYKELGKVAVELARGQEKLDEARLRAITALFSDTRLSEQ